MAQALHIHKNDTAVVTAGNSAGKQGKVLKVFPETRHVIIENVNIIKRHTRPSQKNPQGGIVQKEGPINVANVMVVCPKDDLPTRIRKKQLDNGKWVRSSARSGEMIDTQ